MPGLTGWHWALSAVPLGLALAATVGAVRYAAAEGLGRWLIVAMTLLVGSQVHNLFWPSAYNPVLTTADLLRLGFAAAVVVGGIVALRRVAAERAVALEAEQEASRRLAELAVIRADFSAMVAHELGSPLAAVRRSADLLGTEPLGPIQADAVATIRAEAQVLAGLIADVQTMATVERDDFAVAPFPVAIDLLLADAVAIAKGLPGEHPVACAFNRRERVLADPERIGQVLRNLLGNAAKYSPPGSPIEVRTERRGGQVRVEVVDQGYGIHPDDLARVFEKFGRGRDAEGRRVPGVGLGLYLTRRILQAHGSDLTVSSTLGQGSTFAFELEVAG
jgi:signal transduction histidine kinase